MTSKELKIRRAVGVIEEYTKEVDVTNISGKTDFWNIPVQIAYYGIRKAQKDLFPKVKTIRIRGRELDPNDETHTMSKFRNSSVRKHIGDNPKVKKILVNDHYVKTFSVEPPVATLIDTREYALEDIRVYRYQKKIFTSNDIRIFLEGIVPILGTGYDYGQLLDIAIRQMAGYPYAEKITIFDLGQKRKVCSVGVASDFAYHRHELEKTGDVSMDRLFAKLNSDNWNKNFQYQYNKDGGKWSIENTYPCMFSEFISQRFFNNEFKLVLWMVDGQALYKYGKEI